MKMNKQLTKIMETCTKHKTMMTTNLQLNLQKITVIILLMKNLYLTNLLDTKIITIISMVTLAT